MGAKSSQVTPLSPLALNSSLVGLTGLPSGSPSLGSNGLYEMKAQDTANDIAQSMPYMALPFS